MSSECEANVYKNGKSLFMASTGPTGGANLFEAWICEVREVCGQQLDWHYAGGRANVLYIGDPNKIVDAMYKIPMPAQCTFLGGSNGFEPYRAGVHELPSNVLAYTID
jgi:hypothetical protein